MPGGIVQSGYIITRQGIVAVRGDPTALNRVGRQIADDVVRHVDANGQTIMSAVEIADLANSSAEAIRDQNPTLGAIRVVGSAAFGIAVGTAASPFFTPLGGAVIGFAAGKFYDWLFDRARELDPDPWTGEPLVDPIISPEEISISVNDAWRTSRAPVNRDPLALDLDGDGIETVGVTAGSPVLFDHDDDGVRTGTGWLRGDDAWLVLDRDGNGAIDSGRELFGVDTLITVTEPSTSPGGQAVTYTRQARSGFEALRSLDTGDGNIGSAGYGDGVFDANDAGFAQVRLWQDANQDGISQTAELTTLTQQGIVSINLTPDGTNQNLGNGNTLNGQATVTRTSGSTTVVGGVGSSAANLELLDNPFYREFTDTVPLTAAARDLPGMGGSGWARDLREAMSLQGNAAAAGQALVDAVGDFAAGTTRDAQLAGLDALVEAWDASSATSCSTEYAARTPSRRSVNLARRASHSIQSLSGAGLAAGRRVGLGRHRHVGSTAGCHRAQSARPTAEEIALDTFGFTCGTIQAKVSRVSAGAVIDEKRGAYFTANLALATSTIAVDGKTLNLSSGKSLTAEIKTGRRQVIDYLFRPLRSAAGESLGER